MTETQANTYPSSAQSFGITGIVILGMLLLSPIYLLLNKIINNELSMLIYYLLSIGGPFWMVYTIKKRKTKIGSFNLQLKNPRILLFVILGAIALISGVVTPLSELIPMPEWFKKAILELAGQKSVYSFLTLVIAAPILEELIFRGIVLDGLLKRYSPLISILLSSFLFGFVHLNPWQFITGFVIGAFMGWVYYQTRSVLITILIHASVNATGFLTRFIVKSDAMDQSLIEMYGGYINMILGIILSILIFLACIYFLKKEFKRENVMSIR